MEYRKYGTHFLVRLDPGEEMVKALTKLCADEQVRLASVSGLGAVNQAMIGIFDPVKKEYFGETFEGAYEIASLTGNITRQDGEPYLHLHIVIGNVESGECHAGHLKAAVISATGELVVDVMEGAAGRKFSDTVGLNLIEFPG